MLQGATARRQPSMRLVTHTSRTQSSTHRWGCQQGARALGDTGCVTPRLSRSAHRQAPRTPLLRTALCCSRLPASAMLLPQRQPHVQVGEVQTAMPVQHARLNEDDDATGRCANLSLRHRRCCAVRAGTGVMPPLCSAAHTAHCTCPAATARHRQPSSSQTTTSRTPEAGWQRPLGSSQRCSKSWVGPLAALAGWSAHP